MKMTKEVRRERPLHHVVHDFSELQSAYREIVLSHRPSLNRHCFYSFIAHYRKFANFFSNAGSRTEREKRRQRGEMHASTFTAKGMRYDLREWRKWDHHMNTHFFHLNMARTKNTREWYGHEEVPRMMAEMETAWTHFAANLREPWLTEYKDEMSLRVSAG